MWRSPAPGVALGAGYLVIGVGVSGVVCRGLRILSEPVVQCLAIVAGRSQLLGCLHLDGIRTFSPTTTTSDGAPIASPCPRTSGLALLLFLMMVRILVWVTQVSPLDDHRCHH